VVLPSPRATPGTARLQVDSSSTPRAVAPTLISLQFEEPQPAPTPGQKSVLTVHVEGSDSPLAIVVQNETPALVEFLRGDIQELKTSGGSRNISQIEISAIRSGDYSFNAKLLPGSDISAAELYLQAAVPMASKTVQHRVKALAERLVSHPKDHEK